MLHYKHILRFLLIVYALFLAKRSYKRIIVGVIVGLIVLIAVAVGFGIVMPVGLSKKGKFHLLLCDSIITYIE